MSDKEFSKAFRKEAVKQVVVLEHSVESVSERLGVPEHRLSNWVNAYIRLKQQVDTDEIDVLRKENKRLKKELMLAREELEVLRKIRLRHGKD